MNANDSYMNASYNFSIDIDNDGNLEIFVGLLDGEICFLKRNIPQLVRKQNIPTMSQWGLLIFALLILNLSSWLILSKPISA